MCAEVYRRIETLLQQGDFTEIERLCLHALSELGEPDPGLLFHLGNAARMTNRPAQALVAFRAASQRAPQDANLLQACASCHQALGDDTAALQCMQQAARIAPQDAMVQANHAVALERAGRNDEALAGYDRALALDAANLTANLNRGTLLRRLGRVKEALAHHRHAAELLPEQADVLFNLAGSLLAHFQYREALACCDRALALQPRHAHLLFLKGMLQSCLQQYAAAQETMARARVIEPAVVHDFFSHFPRAATGPEAIVDARGLFIEAMYEAQCACHWEYRADYIQTLRQAADDPQTLRWLLHGLDNGFRIMSLDLDATVRQRILGVIAASVAARARALATASHTYAPPAERLRIGYLSPDLRNHATSILMRQIFGLHDRDTFEIHAFSLHSGKENDPYTRYIAAHCHQFHDVSTLATEEIADRIHACGIDILVDLAGYTTHCRSEVMALRPAPLQLQYLGFAATTMGADFIDYALLDHCVCPDGKLDEFTEQVIRLPHSLYPYDNDVDNAPTTLCRQDFDLPQKAFVFCCLNNSNKIEPRIFDCWMMILKAVPGSVLWLLGKGLDVQDNLEREAAARGVDTARLIFTGRVPLEQHLPRYQLADLFLDTYWHNAHTTGAESLWQGLPLLSILGEVSSARGAASILGALEMPGLIARDFDDYVRLAIFYATHPAEHAAMREKLQAKRYTAPMYNTKLTVRHIERAYQMAWARHLAGLPPESMDVAEITDPQLRASIR